jgi:hypothetical protein
MDKGLNYSKRVEVPDSLFPGIPGYLPEEADSPKGKDRYVPAYQAIKL